MSLRSRTGLPLSILGEPRRGFSQTPPALLALVLGLTSCTSILGTFDYDKGAGGSAASGASSSSSSSSSGGQTCTGAADCTSGFCVEGLCCNTACTDTCHACTAALTGEADGTCAPLTAGSPAPIGQCAAAPPCGNDGKCAAGGVCEQSAQGVACGTTCANGTLTNDQCDGSGTCAPGSGAPTFCPGSLGCDATGTSCLSTCSGDADCTAGHYCSSGACVAVAGLGMPCTANDQCPSKFCADGVCCATACDDMCSSCNLPGSVGTCSTEPDNQNNANHACTSGSTCCGGTCTDVDEVQNCGTCGKACTTTTKCLTPTCSSGSCGSTAVTPGTPCNDSGGSVCNAAGACVQCNTASDCTSGSLTTPGCCNNTCVDLSVSGTNCNACGHDCLGGACSAGACQPVTIATFDVNDDAEGQAIAVDSNNVYWTWLGSTTGGVSQVPLAGGPVTTLATGSSYMPAGLALAAGNVFFANDPDSIEECQVGGCGGTPKILNPAESSPPTAVGVDSKFVYSASSDGVFFRNQNGSTSIGNIGMLVSADVVGLAVDAKNLYWVEVDSGTVNLLATPNVSAGEGPVTTLASNFHNGSGQIALDSTYVYYVGTNTKVTPSQSYVARVAIDGSGGGGTVATLGQFGLSGIAVDASNAYFFVNSPGPFFSHSLSQCSLPDCLVSGAVALAPDRPSAAPIAVDDVAVYWVETGAVLKIAK